MQSSWRSEQIKRLTPAFRREFLQPECCELGHVSVFVFLTFEFKQKHQLFLDPAWLQTEPTSLALMRLRPSGLDKNYIIVLPISPGCCLQILGLDFSGSFYPLNPYSLVSISLETFHSPRLLQKPLEDPPPRLLQKLPEDLPPRLLQKFPEGSPTLLRHLGFFRFAFRVVFPKHALNVSLYSSWIQWLPVQHFSICDSSAPPYFSILLFLPLYPCA